MRSRLHGLSALALATLLSTTVLPWQPARAQVIAPTPAPAAPSGAPASFADLAERLLPAVVNISSTQKAEERADRGTGVPQFPPGSPFEQFFKDFLQRHGNNVQPPPGARAISLGSGFIIDPSGIIVTNNHVIANADVITVILQDNTTLKAEVVGRDLRTDIAVLRVHPAHPLPAVTFGDSHTARVGDWVLAIGNPFGLGGTVTAGIVSARGRDIRQGPYDDFIQTDAAINRGNSGGPLFNMEGQVIGINTAIYSPSGGSVGIGFSLPSSLASSVVAQLREYGKARRGWLGVSIQQVTPDIADSLGLPKPEGALVGQVNPGGPADKAGLRGGDVVLSFDGQSIEEMRTLPRIVAQTAIGKDVPVVVWRGGKQVTLQANVGKMPEQMEANASTAPAAPAPNPATAVSGLGLSLAPITDELRTKYKIGADAKGVVVTDVAGDGPAASRGIKPGDVIVEVQQQAVSSPEDVQKRLDQFREQDRRTVLLLVQSGDGMRWVPLPLKTGTGPAPG